MGRNYRKKYAIDVLNADIGAGDIFNIPLDVAVKQKRAISFFRCEHCVNHRFKRPDKLNPAGKMTCGLPADLLGHRKHKPRFYKPNERVDICDDRVFMGWMEVECEDYEFRGNNF